MDSFSPSYFAAMFHPRKSASGKDSSYEDFIGASEVEPDISITTESFVIHVAHSPSTKVMVDRKEWFTLILHGEIYCTTDSQADFLAQQFAERGIDFARDINGSFAVLLIDKRNSTIAVITDRINSRKVFYSQYKGNYWLSTSLNLHPTSDSNIDPVGVAHYLASGAVFNNRTLFEGIRVLERACVHRLMKNGFQGTKYWSYQFNNAYSNVSEADLVDDLAQLLVDSVRIRLKDNPRIFMSLSGGCDSRTVLGILSRLGIADVECFSYGLGKPKSHSDEYIGRQIANYLGFNHQIIRSFKGNPLDVINRIAYLGRGMLPDICDDIDGWFEMSKDFSAISPGALFVADESVGYYDWKPRSDIDALRCIQICDFSVLSWIRNIVPKKTYDMLREGLNEDILQILHRCPPTENYHDRMDFLYLDQRLTNILLTWREFLSGQFINVRNPFLDNSILDFMAKIPTFLRRDKRLYTHTVTAMLPDLFRFDMAHACSYLLKWKSELNPQRCEIEQTALSEDSRLDSILPYECVRGLLQPNGSNNAFLPRTLIINAAKRVINESRLKESVIGKLMWRYYFTVPFKKIAPHNFLKRFLIVRASLLEERR